MGRAIEPRISTRPLSARLAAYLFTAPIALCVASLAAFLLGEACTRTKQIGLASIVLISAGV